MSIAALLILITHYVLVSILCIYGAHRVYHGLAAKGIFMRVNNAARTQSSGDIDYPHVTVQTPMYNEMFVAKRIIDAVAAFDYPKDKLQIQVIDDSTDESVEIVAETVAYYKSLGFDIDHVRRASRRGYKAGALSDAMEDVKGDYIAIFDADFIPHPDFLKKSLPYFSDPEIGLVQGRWAYLNTGRNMLTRLQSVMLDAHFGIEQVTRYGKGVFFNFNGTAGIWRKETIIDAGGWRADTLTEDTDLSYRAQMRGWKFIYRPDIDCPSEIPEDMNAFKIQQHRWAKGAIEVMKKLLPTIWASDAPRKAKVEATFHLTGNISYLLMFIDSLFFLLPTVHIREQMGPNPLIWLDLPIFAFASLSHAYFFLSSQNRLYGKMWDKLFIMPALLATSIGLGVNNGRAVIEAIIGYKTGFARTPKSGDNTSAISLRKKYQANSQNWGTYLELILGSLYAAFLTWAVMKSYWVVVPFLLLFAIGFFYTGLSSLLETLQRSKANMRKDIQAPSEVALPALRKEPSCEQDSNILLLAE